MSRRALDSSHPSCVFVMQVQHLASGSLAGIIASFGYVFTIAKQFILTASVLSFPHLLLRLHTYACDRRVLLHLLSYPILILLLLFWLS